ncbi:ATP-dependent helicase [Microlunatus ginsengisoli]|uniref:DNA 3'-5' helicase n=1 Tax=Microlunatus ginsengisoli TaxID=363863 RepID=A0ABP6ZW41_9ACTN
MYELIRQPPERALPPALDPSQRAVVDHPGGPLLVLAGPGTGKTTTLVESVVDRIERRGVAPDTLLVLTFSRRAAAELRSRIGARLGRSAVTPMVMTFHAFCYALVRRFAEESPEDAPPRLLTGPEQEFRVREVLAGSPHTGRADWPESVAGAFGTRAFAAEVRAVIAKARQLGMDPEDVVDAGLAAGRPEWVSVGQFFDEYLDVLDAERVLDYAELVHRCRIMLAAAGVADQLRREIGTVFVDEYQDTDPAQVALLQTVAGDGRDVVVFGDPDQSIYAFRGAEARGILDFPDLFTTVAGARAPVVALGQTRRFGPRLLAASRSLVGRLGVPRSLPGEVFETFRSPVCAPGTAKGRVEVFTCVSPGAEAEHIAELLRAAHLRDGIAWPEMAVLVRSGRRTIPMLGRALIAAGVPVEVAGDEIPLAAEAAVRPLLTALHVASGPVRPTTDEAQTLLMSPLGGLDSMAIRRLGRALRDAERRELAGVALPRPSVELLAAALHDPALLDELADSADAAAARRLARLLHEAAAAIGSGRTAEEVLWLLWSGTGWPERLRTSAAGAGDVGRRANRDLDAVCALFAIAARSEEVSGLRGVTGFLAEVEGQQIPADPLRESPVRGGGVRLLTAHRAKGLEWELVVVAGVQEGVWPDVRRRGSLLEADRLSRRGVVDPAPTAVRIAEERRLFYVACTRARSRLIVTAVDGTEGEGDQPSRFLTELDVSVGSRPGRPRRPLSLPALVAELRSVSVDPERSPALREQAAVRLARLADSTDDEGRPLVPAARPANWWGMRPLSDAPDGAGTAPVQRPGDPVHLSGSQLGTVLGCPRQWFLSRKASAETPRQAAASFGSVIHVLAEHGARSGVDADQMAAHLETVWDQLDFDANWLSATERIEAEAALERFAGWQQARSGQQLLGTEVPFECEIVARGERVRLTGTADRVERDPDGRVRIVDFKTSRAPLAAADVMVHDQLGVYQLAVAAGAFAAVAGPGARPGGAELVFLRLSDGSGPGPGLPKVFGQPSLDDQPFPLGWPEGTGEAGPDVPTWVHGRLADAAAIIRAERFDATIGPACRWCAFRTSCPAQSAGKQVVA